MSFRALRHNDTFLRQVPSKKIEHPVVAYVSTFLQHTQSSPWIPAQMTADYMSNFFIVVLRKPRVDLC